MLRREVRIARGYRSRGRFITNLTLDPLTSTSDFAGPPHLEEDWLTLSTIHSAKGCKWRAVHIIHAADGMIPSDMALGDSAGEDEERRLFYVAMTRAKDMLYVYFPVRYYHRRFGLGDTHSYAQLTLTAQGDHGQAYAVINGTTVGVGGAIGKFVVESISSGVVILAHGENQRIALRMD